MPTLDRRLLAWSDSDTDDDGHRLLATPTNRRGFGATSYDRACAAAASVDGVLVPAGADDEDSPRTGTSPSWSGTRKAFVAAGLVAGGCLCAYLAWRYCGSTGKLSVSS
ncbi:unnamed protein product [Urochloa humidicola]